MNIEQALVQGKEAHLAGRLGRAREAYEQVLAVEPNNIEARHLVGVLDLQEGHAEAAVRRLREVVTEAPEQPKFRLNLALALLESGDIDGARDGFAWVVARQPNHLKAVANLARMEQLQGRHLEAFDMFSKAIALSDQIPELFLNRGVSAVELGRLKEAEADFERALLRAPMSMSAAANLDRAIGGVSRGERRNRWQSIIARCPVCPGGHLALAKTLARSGEWGEAERHLARACMQAPLAGSPRRERAQLLFAQGRLAEARKLADDAVSLEPDDIVAMELAARIAFDQRDIGRVHELYGLLLERDPNNGFALAGEASRRAAEGDVDGVLALFEGREMTETLQQIQDFAVVSSFDKRDADKARSLLGPLLVKHPDDPSLVRLLSSLADTTERRIEAVAALRDALSRRPQSFLHFELARLNDKLGAYAEAWEHAENGNATYRNPFDRERSAEIVSRTIGVFGKDWFAGVEPSSCGDAPIFIVGMPRSGTTLTEQVLDQHSSLFGVGESTAAGDVVPLLRAGRAGLVRFPEAALGVSKTVLSGMANRYTAQVQAEVPSLTNQRIVDKMPGNFRFVGLLHRMFPKAKFVWCRRDWRDNLISLYFGSFAGTHHYAYDPQDIVAEYQGHQRLMRHWQSMGIPVLEHRYSDVIDDFEGSVRRLLDFVGVEFEPACLEFHRSDKVVQTMSYRQVRQPLYKSSLARWKRYESQLTDALGSELVHQESLDDVA